MSLQDKLFGFRSEKLKAEKEAGAKFLQENKNKPGVTELPNGIQYEVLKEGEGIQPKPNSNIRAHYRGSLLNGKEFDSS
jgi:FKBP-type peptidyl-prolyl cis-trans isomerase FklB